MQKKYLKFKKISKMSKGTKKHKKYQNTKIKITKKIIKDPVTK